MTRRAEIEALVARLEAATEGSRELDHLVAPHIAGRWVSDDEWHPSCCDPAVESRIPEWTTSIDAALSLVPDGWQWVVRKCPPRDEAYGPFFANVTQLNRYNEGPTNPVRATTPALALCAAALRAHLAAMKEEKDG